jgi:hypothetical protein
MGTWFDVEVSMDGHNYHPVAVHQTLTSWNMETLPLPKPTRAAYIRLHWHNPQQKPVSFSVFELEAH